MRELFVTVTVLSLLMSACGDPAMTSSSAATSPPSRSFAPSPTTEARVVTPAPSVAVTPTATITPPPPGSQHAPPTAPPEPPTRLPKPTVRHSGESVRLDVDGSYFIPDGGDGCTYVEVFRGLIPSSADMTPVSNAVLVITLQSFDCYDGYYHYTPATGELAGFLP